MREAWAYENDRPFSRRGDSVIERRKLIGASAGAAICVSLGAATPFTAVAQQTGKLPRIGWLGLNAPETAPHQAAAFRQGLREHGWVEGRNIVIENRYADGRPERLPALVAELIRLDVDVIVTTSSVVTRAAMNSTRSIPIVMAASANALDDGLVVNLARPGGNVTGMTFLAGPEIAGKQLELLFELVPTSLRIAVLVNPDNRSHRAFSTALENAARSLKLRLQVLEARSPDQFDAAFAAMAREGAAALVLTDAMFFGQHRRLAGLATRARLPALYSQREFVEAGGLVSYGPSLADMFRRAATPVDKILKGAAPGDIPVEQPTKFEFVVNLKAAKALGLAVPQSSLLRADEVLQ
jgi:putative ABC transport system substrate-binding protein